MNEKIPHYCIIAQLYIEVRKGENIGKTIEA